MNTSPNSHRMISGSGITMTLIIFSILTFAAAKLSGTLDPMLAKRGVGICFGGFLIVLGNILPKLIRPLSKRRGEDHGNAMKSTRLTGWIFALAGSAYAASWTVLPLSSVGLISSIIGLSALAIGSFFYIRPLLGQEWLAQDFATLFAMLTLSWLFTIFLSDHLWGDAAAKWIAIGYPVVLGILGTAITRATTGGED